MYDIFAEKGIISDKIPGINEIVKYKRRINFN